MAPFPFFAKDNSASNEVDLEAGGEDVLAEKLKVYLDLVRDEDNEFVALRRKLNEIRGEYLDLWADWKSLQGEFLKMAAAVAKRNISLGQFYVSDMGRSITEIDEANSDFHCEPYPALDTEQYSIDSIEAMMKKRAMHHIETTSRLNQLIEEMTNAINKLEEGWKTSAIEYGLVSKYMSS